MSSSQYDIRNNKQKEIKTKIYYEEECVGIVDIGNNRKNQEDSLLILNHPYYNTELLLIADGMGGLENGAQASNTVAKEIMQWFLNYNFLHRDTDAIVRDYNKAINYIDEILRKDMPNSGSTLVSAISKDEETIITNVGDSRCYLYDITSFYQITEDHNLAWNYYKNGIINNKDDLRYRLDNNLLTSRLGWKEKMLKIDNYILNNQNYDKLLLCSDGFSDILPDYIIKRILETQNDVMIESLMDYIKDYTEINEYHNDMFKNKIDGGADNISIIVKQKVKK